MKKTNFLHAVSFAGLLALPVAASSQTVTPDDLGEDSEMPSLEEISNMTIAELVKLKIGGEPLTVYVHLGEGEDKNIIIYSASAPDGMWQPDDGGGDDPVATPLPGAVWLLGSGMVGLAAIARRRYNGNSGGGDAAVQPACA